MQNIQAGDSFKYSIPEGNYSSAEGWTAKLFLRGSINVDITASPADLNYVFSATKNETALWAPGRTAYFISVENNNERIKIEEGEVDILPDYSGVVNIKSWAEKTLSAVEATIMKRATSDQLNYTVDGISIGKMPMTDLLTLANRLKYQIRSEKNAERISQGLGITNVIKVRI